MNAGPTIHGSNDASDAPPCRRFGVAAFTLVEVLVATVLLLAIMGAVSQIFTISSETAGRSAAQAEAIQAAATFERAVRDQVARLRPDSLLIIESPSAVTGRADVSGNKPVLSLRHDRLVFIAQGTSDQFVSATDSNTATNLNPLARPASSGDALVFFGPCALPPDADNPGGRPVANQTLLSGDPSILAKEWIASYRAVLLGPSNAAFVSFTGESPPAQYPDGGLTTNPPFGIYAAGMDAVVETADELLTRLTPDLDAGNSNPHAGLWDCNVCPDVTNNTLPTAPDNNYGYYRRAAFALQPRIADIRIEWSDGTFVDPRDMFPNDGQADDPTTQWFGARHDTAASVVEPANTGWTAPNGLSIPSGDTATHLDYVTAFGTLTLPLNVELFDVTTNAYRAVWTRTSWSRRPTALRITFRVFDSQERLSTIESVNMTPWTGTPAFTPIRRYGTEFSFVVEVP